jgi:hypothetical protein
MHTVLGLAWPEGDAPYTEELRQIDAEICRLVAARVRSTGDLRVVPDEAQMMSWAEECRLGQLRVRNVIAAVASATRLNSLPPEPRGLIAVVPLLRRQVAEAMEFTLTHVMQYENASVVHLDVRVDSGAMLGHAQRFELEVGVEGYEVWHVGGAGSDTHRQADFIVRPTLPDDLAMVAFTLRPGRADPPRPEPRRLMQAIAFGPAPVG